jgi:hypothetical protein
MKIDPKVYSIVACAWALGGIVALLAYLDNKKLYKMKKEIMEIDLEMKKHQLTHRKNQ